MSMSSTIIYENVHRNGRVVRKQSLISQHELNSSEIVDDSPSFCRYALGLLRRIK